MALHQLWDKHSFLRLPFIPYIWECVCKSIWDLQLLYAAVRVMNEIYCYRAAAVMHTTLRRNFTFTDTRFSPQQSGRCVESDNCIEIETTTATETSFYFSSVLEKQSVAAFTVTPPKRSLSISLSAGGGRQMSSIGAWSQAKSFNISSPIIFDSFERRRLLSRNLCSPNWQRWHGQAWEESGEREYEI